MMFWMALIAPLLFQEPADDLRKEVEKLKKQIVELQERPPSVSTGEPKLPVLISSSKA